MADRKFNFLVTRACVVQGKIKKKGEKLSLDDATLKQLMGLHRGTIIEDVPEDSSASLADMTRAELDAFAAKHEIDVSEAKTKPDVLALIEAALED